MNDERQTQPLSAVADIIPGTSPKGEDINDDPVGLPFYQGSKEFGLRHPAPERWTTKPVKSAKVGDILLSVRAPVGRVNIADQDCAIGRGVMAVRPKVPADRDYIAALLGAMGAEWEAHSTEGTMFANLSRVALGKADIWWPADRYLLGSVVAAIDDRIESMIRVCSLLGEAIAAECHVSFENRTSEDEMSLVEAVRLVNGGAYTKDASGTGRMVVRIRELNSGPSETTVYNDITVPENKTVRPGDVLFAWSGSLGVWRWYRGEAIVNQHIFKVLAKSHPVWLGLVHIQDALAEFQDIAAGKATTMGHVTKDHLERARVPVLSDAELSNLAKRVEPLWDYQLHAGREVLSLGGLRDFLLPRLLSGELRVNDFEGVDDLAGASR